MRRCVSTGSAASQSSGNSVILVNDDEYGLHEDYEEWLEGLPPHTPVSQYLHNRAGEDNADAHMKRQIVGREVVVAVTNGRLDLGTWEWIFCVSWMADTEV